MPKFSIIIPHFGEQKLIDECIAQIRACTTDYEIIIVDNASGCVFPADVQVISNFENVGFPKAVNQGVMQSRGEIVIIMNNDVIVSPNWATRLAAHLGYADLVGPVTNNVSGPQSVTDFQPNTTDEIALYANTRYNQMKLQSDAWPRLVFFCVAIKKSVFNKIGLLDEQFSPGNFEDDDFCLRAIGADFKLVIAHDVFVHHYGSMSFKKDPDAYQKLLETNAAKFAAKWPAPVIESLRKKCLINSL